MPPPLHSLAKMIDHSLLHPTMTEADLLAGCDLARHYDVASVCIKPYAVTLACQELLGSDVVVGTVVGFPHGNSRTAVKLQEAELAINDGARELDMVVNIGKVLGEEWDYVSDEIRLLNDLATSAGGLLKVIFENDYLSDDRVKIQLCRTCSELGVAFAKTSTSYGFVKQPDGSYNYAGATDYDLALMRRHCAPWVQIKAAGGVRTLDDLLRVRELGVTRVGATATAAILDEARQRGYA